MFNETYSPRVSDAAWLGMHKQDHFANYVAVSPPSSSSAVCVL